MKEKINVVETEDYKSAEYTFSDGSRVAMRRDAGKDAPDMLIFSVDWPNAGADFAARILNRDGEATADDKALFEAMKDVFASEVNA